MRKITKILFGLSSSFMLIWLGIMIMRKGANIEGYFGISDIFTYIETFEGYEVLETSINNINLTINESFNGWSEFNFASSNMNEFFSNIGSFFNNLGTSLVGIFKLIIYGVKGVWDFLWYLVSFVISFMEYIMYV